MNYVDITIFFNERRLKLLEPHLREIGSSTEQALRNALREIYVQNVPYEERMVLEEQLKEEAEQERIQRENERRFSVIHLHDAEGDCFLTSDTRTDFYSIASLYRMHLRDEVGTVPIEDLPPLFGVMNEIDPFTFSSVCEDISVDRRITVLAELDFENGNISIREREADSWRTYALRDASTAVYKAERRQGIPLDARREIFSTALEGKELVMDDSLETQSEVERGSMELQM